MTGGIISSLLSYVLLYKYLAIFIITYLGAIAFPVPSGTVIMASAAFSLQGYLNFPLIIIVGVIGNVAGDNSGYWLARRFGPEILRKIGLGKLLNHDKTELVRAELARHPIMFIYSSRFMTTIAPMVNVVSGVTKLPYKKYLTFEFLGECTEVIFFATCGFIFGANWMYFAKYPELFLIIIITGLVITYSFWHLVIKRKDRSDPMNLNR